jgi:CheY-like chemotaxis protein
VIEAVNGEDAVRQFEANKENINLLLFDLVMPKMNGKLALEAIRGLKPDIKGIFVSGYAPENMQQRDLFDLHTEVLFKPVSPKELLKTIRKVLDAT